MTKCALETSGWVSNPCAGDNGGQFAQRLIPKANRSRLGRGVKLWVRVKHLIATIGGAGIRGPLSESQGTRAMGVVDEGQAWM